jgi:hypothetical protein
MARYSRLNYTVVSPNYIGNIAGGGSTEAQVSHTGALSFTRIASSSVVADLAVGFTRLEDPRSDSSRGFDVTTIGLPASINAVAQNHVFPRFNPAGYMSLGNTADIPLSNFGNMYSTRGSLSSLKGAHFLKMGFEWQVRQVNQSQGGTTGAYASTAGFTQGPNPLAASAGAGDGWASLLLGTLSTGSLGLVPFVSTQNSYFGFYLQDDWHVTRALTLNLGIRYEVELPRHERYNRQNYLDLNVLNPLSAAVGIPVYGGLEFDGVNGNPTSPYNTDWNNVSPRFGFAYQVTPATVVRGGYGIFYGVPPVGAAGLAGGNVGGFSVSTPMVVSLDGVTPFSTLENPYPSGFVMPSGSAAGLLTQVGQSISSVLRNSATPYSQQWNMNVQRQAPGNLLFEAAYAGSRGVDLQLGSFSYDALPDQYLALGNHLNDLVANPFFGNINVGVLAQPTVQRKQLLIPYPQFTGVSVPKDTLGQFKTRVLTGV